MWPDAPEWAEPSELGPEVLRDLRGLSKENSDFVARHLVAATSLADEEPEEAWVHARAARSKGGRIAVVRETVGLVAYRAQEWAEAISELRAARRMGGGPGHVAILADCERALGNPERALDLARSPEASQLDPDGAAELRIVASGARADLGQLDAAMAVLQDGPGFDLNSPETYSARLYYAYADLLLTTGDADGALEWFARADDADDDGDTDAADRIADLIAIREGRAPDADTGSGEGDADTRVAVEERPLPKRPLSVRTSTSPAKLPAPTITLGSTHLCLPTSSRTIPQQRDRPPRQEAWPLTHPMTLPTRKPPPGKPRPTTTDKTGR